jgi:hypothetical protein
MSERHYKHCLGFFPTAKNDEAELKVYSRIKERCKEWILSKELHSGNIRSRFHDIFMFAKYEGQLLFDHALAKPLLNNLFSTFEACHTYITTVIFSLISEDSMAHHIDLKIKRQKINP